MTFPLSCLLWIAQICSAADPSTVLAGYLYHSILAADGCMNVQTTPYYPQEGDLVIFTYWNPIYRFCYGLAGSGPPYHAGIVVRMPNGRLATLEAGADMTYQVYLMPLPERFPAYKGRIWVRRLQTPLCGEESARLTDWACHQTGKGFAFGRLFLGTTFCRPRGWIGAKLFGETCLDRNRWFCSELTVAACVVAGRVDAEDIPANGIYPRDLFLDESFDFSAHWGPPLLWTEAPGTCTADGLIEQDEFEMEELEILTGKEGQ